MTHTPATLIAFRDRVAAAFEAKRIRCPVHLPSDTQAEPLVEIFKDFRPGDHLFSGWRNMWHCLLAGMPEEELFRQILDGRSMYVMSKEHRVFCSSIVGGILPIALGVAWAVNIRHMRNEFAAAMREEPGTDRPTIWVFVGDMTERTGLFDEFAQYAEGHGLPVRVVVEDNGLSTNTPTGEVWGQCKSGPMIFRYKYTRNLPHVGLSKHVVF